MMSYPSHFLTDNEVREFQVLAATHAGAALTLEQADTLAHQLLRLLLIVRDVTRHDSTDSTRPVDDQALPKSGNYVDTTHPSS
jgi:hypothetical protein